MNKPIFDLLDAYEDDSVELADAAPLSSARIKELTMNNITTKTNKRTLRRAPLRLLAAAAAAAALVFSAVATNALGAGDFMKGMFAAWNKEPLTATQVEILNSIGHVFDGSDTYSVTSNGATITPISAMADEDSYYLHLRVEAPEGVVLPDLDWDNEIYALYGLEADKNMELGVSWDVFAEAGEPYWAVGSPFGPGIVPKRGSICYGCETLPDDDSTDNVKDIVLTIFSEDYHDIKFNDGRPKQLSIKGLWLQSRCDNEFGWTWTEIFRGDFLLDIGEHFESQVAAIDCGGALWSDPDTGEINYLDAMKLSPLGLKFEFRSNVIRESRCAPGHIRIVMKDGSEMELERPSYHQASPERVTEESNLEYGFYRMFEAPLDLSQVDYVQLGEDYIYPITMG